MPTCRECGIMQATVNMRRAPSSTEWLCKDKGPCKQRRAAARARAIALKKGQQ